MPLTTAQLQALKADIAANANTIPAGQSWSGSFAGTAISALPVGNADAAFAIAGWYSQLASPAYYVIRTDAPILDIFNAVTWANYTPADAPTSGNAAQATAAALYCQGKQFNLELMFFGKSSFDATKGVQTAGLKDATTQLPSKTGFVMQTGGWTNIIPVLQRQAKYVEKLFAAASTLPALQNGASARGTQYDGTNGNPDVMGYEGSITYQDVLNAWAS